MIADHMRGIEQFESELWRMADTLRANSNLASNEYFMPILGLIFLRQATNRYHQVSKPIVGYRVRASAPKRYLVEGMVSIDSDRVPGEELMKTDSRSLSPLATSRPRVT